MQGLSPGVPLCRFSPSRHGWPWLWDLLPRGCPFLSTCRHGRDHDTAWFRQARVRKRAARCCTMAARGAGGTRHDAVHVRKHPLGTTVME